MIGIYHSRDLDGFTSGAIIKRRFPDAILIGYDYGQPFDFSLIENEQVIMADVSLPMEQMILLAGKSSSFTWIDHHISAIKEYQSQPAFELLPIETVLDSKLSACELTWNYLFPDEEMPRGIKYLGEYDTWRNDNKDRWENEILPYQFGMRLRCSSPHTFPWESVVGFLDVAEEYNIIFEGKIILKYQSHQNQRACNSSFECEFEGLRAICLNGGGFNSEAFKSVYDEEKHDIMMPFQYNGKFWVISMYTTKDIDCSVIAKSRGGGGHKKAAGFQVDDIRSVFPHL